MDIATIMTICLICMAFIELGIGIFFYQKARNFLELGERHDARIVELSAKPQHYDIKAEFKSSNGSLRQISVSLAKTMALSVGDVVAVYAIPGPEEKVKDAGTVKVYSLIGKMMIAFSGVLVVLAFILPKMILP